MAKRKVSNLLALAVLSYLTQRPMHPYEMQRNLRENDAARTFKLSYGSLYTVVRQLATAGFIEAQATSREGNLPERTVYQLTAAGRSEMVDWLRQLVAEPQQEHSAFVAALSLIVVLPPDEAVSLLKSRLDLLVAECEGVRQTIDRTMANGVHPIFLVEDEYRLAMVAAEAEFIRQFIANVTRQETGWAEPWAAFNSNQASPATAGEEK